MLERRSEDELHTRLRQQATVAELGRVALAGMPLDQLLDEALAGVAEELGSPYAAVTEAVRDGRLVVRATLGMPGATPGEELTPDEAGQAQLTLATGEAVVSGDIGQEARFAHPAYLHRAGVRSVACVLIGPAEQPFGVLGASSRRVDDFSDDDVNVLQGVANVIAAAVQRSRVEDELRAALAQVTESEVRFRELADSAPVFIWTTDSQGMVNFINRGWLDFTGRPLEEELGDSWGLGVHSDDVKAVTETWQRALARQVPWEREYRLRRHDGEYRWIVDRGVPRFSAGEFLGYVGTATDTHERKGMEQKLSQAYERDHQVAETLQRSLLPERLPHIDGVELDARYIPASRGAAVGGDWYDAIELDDGRVAVVVGDVVGHGLRAAAVMGQLRNAFRAYALVESSPADTLARLNRLLGKDDGEVMATALYLLLDRDTGELAYSSAGHPPALVMAPDGPRFLEHGRSVPLGTVDPAAYRDAEDRLEPGSTLLLYTDGLVERRDTPLEDRLAQLATVAEVADGELGDVCDEVLSGVLGGLRPEDDVALLAVRPAPVMADRLSMRMPADPAALATLRRRLGRFLSAAGASAEEQFEITLTVCEAASNAIEHAYGPDDAAFEVEARVDGGQVFVSVSDGGSWREPRGEDRGRGLSIIDSLMDELEVSSDRSGTTVRMRRRLGIGAAP